MGWTNNPMDRQYIDDLGRKIIYKYPPKRIISLVPSITELLFDLKVGDRVIATTDYCIYPEQTKKTIKIGGTKTPNIQKIIELKPDIVLAEKSENTKNAVRQLENKLPVFVFEVRNFDDAIRMIRTCGDLVGDKPMGRIISEKIMQKFIDYNIDFQYKTVFFPVWKNPYITVADGSFVNSMLNLIKLKNIFEHKDKTYPKISETEIKNNCPDFIFLTNEPYNFTEKDAQEFKDLCPEARTVFVKGEMFIWFGSRMLKAADYFYSLNKQLL